MNRRGLIVLISISPLLTPFGCGGSTSSSTPESSPQQVELREVGEMCRIFLADNKRPPQAVKDLLKYAPAFDFGAMALQQKRVLVRWGVDLAPGSKEVLAYQKEAPEAGGLVLLRDGYTLVPMTAQDVQAAIKSPG